MKNDRNDRYRDLDTSRARRGKSRRPVDEVAEIDLGRAYRDLGLDRGRTAGADSRSAPRTSSGSSTRSTGGPAQQRPRTARPSADGTPPNRRPPRSGKSGQPAPSGRQRRPKRRKNSTARVLVIALLIVLLIPTLALGAGYLYVSHATSGQNAGMGVIDTIINTPKEYSGDVVNVLVCGIDYEEGRTHALTDMILYVNFDVKNSKVNMLQIPRDTYVGGEYSSNGKINGVAAKAGENGNLNISALADRINAMFQLPIDGYITIDMDSMKELVNYLGGVEVYVPRDMEYNGSKLEQGYRMLDGDAAEFFVRNRHGDGYATGDFARLEMQRYFYAGLFKALLQMTPGDIAKMFPVYLKYVKTDMGITDLVGIGLSALKVSTQNIMMCRVPEYGGAELYQGEHAVNVVARQETAGLLNTYFRSYGAPVDAAALQLEDYPSAGGLHDAAISYMDGSGEKQQTDTSSASQPAA